MAKCWKIPHGGKLTKFNSRKEAENIIRENPKSEPTKPLALMQNIKVFSPWKERKEKKKDSFTKQFAASFWVLQGHELCFATDREARVAIKVITTRDFPKKEKKNLGWCSIVVIDIGARKVDIDE